MICLLALIVFSVLGIFSVKYRKIAAQAFDCVFRRITLRPCQSGLDRKLKTRVVGIVSRKNIKLARFIVKNFEIISWTFTLVLLLSIFFSVRGIYFYALYGNCNGINSGFCVFDALLPEQASTCADPSLTVGKDFIKPNEDDDPYLGPEDAKVTIIEFGCYACPYTKQAEPVVKEVLEKYEGKIRFVYRDFSLPTHENSELAAMAAQCANDQNMYWEYHDSLFELEEYGFVQFNEIASNLKLDRNMFSNCLNFGLHSEEVKNDFEDGKAAGVYGTPTFFINDEVVVGPKPFRYFKNIIDKELS